MSSIPGVSEKLTAAYPPPPFPPTPSQEPASTQSLLSALHLEPHIEGGYFAELDRNPLTIPNPFLHDEPHSPNNTTPASPGPFSGATTLRNASTSIYYLLAPSAPQGHFHRNKGRTVHTLVEGRGRYVLIHADEPGERKRVESFAVGTNVSGGEKSVWVVEGGKYKASYLLPAAAHGEKSDADRLLISETVVPGFEYADHDFLTLERFRELVTEEQARELEWLVRRG
ncbi:hypothetical protein ACN47E_009931 [Coniothyrium glycines]